MNRKASMDDHSNQRRGLNGTAQQGPLALNFVAAPLRWFIFVQRSNLTDDANGTWGSVDTNRYAE